MDLKNSKKESNIKHIVFILIGIGLIIIALAIPAATFAPVFKAEINYQLNNKNRGTSEIIPIDKDFSIVIPKINANTKVLKNIDPFDSKIYQLALSKGVAHAKGTATPNIAGNTFIFAHSAGNWYQANQFNAVFYLLNKLEVGDEINVYYQSQKYVYSVSENKIVNSNESEYMSNNSLDTKLTLMTCWPPGTTLKRLVIIAIPKDDNKK